MTAKRANLPFDLCKFEFAEGLALSIFFSDVG
jgi:hypothetical protein